MAENQANQAALLNSLEYLIQNKQCPYSAPNGTLLHVCYQISCHSSTDWTIYFCSQKKMQKQWNYILWAHIKFDVVKVE